MLRQAVEELEGHPVTGISWIRSSVLIDLKFLLSVKAGRTNARLTAERAYRFYRKATNEMRRIRRDAERLKRRNVDTTLADAAHEYLAEKRREFGRR